MLQSYPYHIDGLSTSETHGFNFVPFHKPAD